MKLPPSHQDSPRHTEWLARVIQLESEGLDRSDAQGIADMEAEQNMKETIKTKSNMSTLEIQDRITEIKDDIQALGLMRTDKMIGNCTQNDVIEDIFGSVSEFARQIEENGDEFLYKDQIVITYDEANDIHCFFYL